MSHRDRPTKPSETSTRELIDVMLGVLHEARLSNRYLRRLLEIEEPKPITGFTFKRIGDLMLPITPGTSGIKFVATPQPAGAELPEGAQLEWVSNDPNVTAVADPSDTTGLTVDVSISASATLGEQSTITLTATGTNGDGTPLNASGSFNITEVAPAAPNVTGFTFAQSA